MHAVPAIMRLLLFGYCCPTSAGHLSSSTFGMRLHSPNSTSRSAPYWHSVSYASHAHVVDVVFVRS